jgi:hypothetical protein
MKQAPASRLMRNGSRIRLMKAAGPRYARPFAQAQAESPGRVQVSINAEEFPVWAPEGRELFFMSGESMIYAADIRSLGRSGTPAAPVALFRVCPDTVPAVTALSGAPYMDAFDTLDAERFLGLLSRAETGQLHCPNELGNLRREIRSLRPMREQPSEPVCEPLWTTRSAIALPVDGNKNDTTPRGSAHLVMSQACIANRRRMINRACAPES